MVFERSEVDLPGQIQLAGFDRQLTDRVDHFADHAGAVIPFHKGQQLRQIVE